MGEVSHKPDMLTDAQVAGYWWLGNLNLAKRLRKKYSERIIVVQANDIAERAEQVLGRIARLPSMHGVLEEICTMMSGNVGSTYSKRREELL